MSSGNILEIIAIFSAIQIFMIGIVLTIILHFLNKKWNRYETDVKNIKRNWFFIVQMANNLTDTICALRAEMQFQNGLLRETFKQEQRGMAKAKILDVIFRKSELDIQRCLQTLMIFSDNTVRKESAYKQLREEFGNAETLISLESLKDYEKEQVELLKWAIAGLKKRINRAVEQFDHQNRLQKTIPVVVARTLPDD